MSSGGARARSGPPPDPNALRRERDGKSGEAWVVLPISGRDGPTPDWPLSSPSGRELDLWAGEWRRPQAVMWEANGQHVEVAVYVRSLVAAESVKATAAERTLVLRQMETLGISMPGLARNRWRIGEPVASEQGSAPARRKGARSVRDRLKVIDGGTS